MQAPSFLFVGCCFIFCRRSLQLLSLFFEKLTCAQTSFCNQILFKPMLVSLQMAPLDKKKFGVEYVNNFAHTGLERRHRKKRKYYFLQAEVGSMTCLIFLNANEAAQRLWVFSADIAFRGSTSVAVGIIRNCMGKSLDHRARIFTNNKTGIIPVSWPYYVNSGENHLNQNRSRKVRHDLPHPACTFVCHTTAWSYDENATEAMKAHTWTFCSLRRWQWAVLRASLPNMSRKGHVNRSNQSPSRPPPQKKKNK